VVRFRTLDCQQPQRAGLSMMIAFSALFCGAVLGTRFNVVVLGLAVGAALSFLLATGTPLLEAALVGAGLQVGYLIGVASRIGFEAFCSRRNSHCSRRNSHLIHARSNVRRVAAH
jgi:hypothetical protein